MLKQRSQALSFKSGKNSKKLENLTVINSMSIRPLLKENWRRGKLRDRKREGMVRTGKDGEWRKREEIGREMRIKKRGKKGSEGKGNGNGGKEKKQRGRAGRGRRFYLDLYILSSVRDKKNAERPSKTAVVNPIYRFWGSCTHRHSQMRVNGRVYECVCVCRWLYIHGAMSSETESWFNILYATFTVRKIQPHDSPPSHSHIRNICFIKLYIQWTS